MDDDGLSSPVVDAISCQVQNAVASTQQDLLSNIITLMDCRLTSLQKKYYTFTRDCTNTTGENGGGHDRKLHISEEEKTRISIVTG